MLTILAQATQPTDFLSRIPFKDLTALIVALTALIAAIKAMRGSSAAQASADVNTQNIGTLGANVQGVSSALNQSPGPNVPHGVVETSAAIAADPTRATQPPPSTAPIFNGTVRT